MLEPALFLSLVFYFMTMQHLRVNEVNLSFTDKLEHQFIHALYN